MESIMKLFISTLALIQSRAELLGVEIREERYRWFLGMIYITFASVFGIMTLISLNVCIIFFVANEYRVYAFGIFFVIYLMLSLLCIRLVIKKIHSATTFNSTTDELKKDQECLHSLE